MACHTIAKSQQNRVRSIEAALLLALELLRACPLEYRGLRNKMPALHHDPALFARWCLGRTGEPLVDAAMPELLASGYLSNRLRQVVASYLIRDLACDWRAGAAWFESHLIDYDVYNNQGNWLYIAGMGTDPRGGRRFDVVKQTCVHDPEGSYRQLWQQV